VDKSTFLRNLWWCFDRLEEKATDDSGKPAYFRFLTLLGDWEWGREAGFCWLGWLDGWVLQAI
jgi:hypothetical protein